MPVLVAGCLLAYKECGAVVGGELVPRKVLLQKKESSPHRYSAVDPDLSIVLSLMTAKKGPPKDTKCAGLLGFTKEANNISNLLQTDRPFLVAGKIDDNLNPHRFVFVS